MTWESSKQIVRLARMNLAEPAKLWAKDCSSCGIKNAMSLMAVKSLIIQKKRNKKRENRQN